MVARAGRGAVTVPGARSATLLTASVLLAACAAAPAPDRAPRPSAEGCAEVLSAIGYAAPHLPAAPGPPAVTGDSGETADAAALRRGADVVPAMGEPPPPAGALEGDARGVLGHVEGIARQVDVPGSAELAAAAGDLTSRDVPVADVPSRLQRYRDAVAAVEEACAG